MISRHRKAFSVGHQFEEIKILDDGNIGSDDEAFSDEENNTSLPYFNPRTHPLFAKSFPSTEQESFLSMNTEFTDSTFENIINIINEETNKIFSMIFKFKELFWRVGKH